MGLSVYLKSNEAETITCFNCNQEHKEFLDYFESNITHNLVPMAKEAGLFEAMWNSDSQSAKDIIKPLSRGLERIKENPNRFRELNPKSGWGNHKLLVEFVSKYLEACRRHPDARIVSHS